MTASCNTMTTSQEITVQYRPFNPAGHEGNECLHSMSEVSTLPLRVEGVALQYRRQKLSGLRLCFWFSIKKATSCFRTRLWRTYVLLLADDGPALTDIPIFDALMKAFVTDPYCQYMARDPSLAPTFALALLQMHGGGLAKHCRFVTLSNKKGGLIAYDYPKQKASRSFRLLTIRHPQVPSFNNHCLLLLCSLTCGNSCGMGLSPYLLSWCP